MDGDYLKEQIKHETELMRAALLLMIVIGGGTFGLFLGELTLLRIGFAGAGLIGTVGLAAGFVRQEHVIRILLARLKEETP